MSAISDKYNQPECQFLGQPTNEEQICQDGVGHFRHFQNGSIFWHPDTGAHEVHGSIRVNWSSHGWERSFLGYPVTDETTTPDGSGRFNHFQHGSIYWHPKTGTGAHEVHGGILNLWRILGWEKSYLGYPLTDELAPPGELRCQKFQGGSIVWTPKGNAKEVPGAATRYLIGINTFRIGCTRAVHEDTDHIKLSVAVDNVVLPDLPVIHVGDVNDGDHLVDLYYMPPIELPKIDSVITFNYIIENIGSGNYTDIENGMKAAAEIGLSAWLGPAGAGIGEIADGIYHIFNAKCDGPVAIDQVSATGHLLNSWTAASRVYSETRFYTYGSQTFCGDSPQYWVTWSVIRL